MIRVLFYLEAAASKSGFFLWWTAPRGICCCTKGAWSVKAAPDGSKQITWLIEVEVLILTLLAVISFTGAGGGKNPSILLPATPKSQKDKREAVAVGPSCTEEMLDGKYGKHHLAEEKKSSEACYEQKRCYLLSRWIAETPSLCP